jgi:hypothetical protein
MIADVFAAVRRPPSTTRHLTEAPTIVEHAEVPELVREVVRERNYLRTVIRRALRELPVPASYGPGTVWNDMLDIDAENVP